MKLLMAFIQDKKGTTSIEYGLIAALISVAAIGCMSYFGTQLTATFKSVAMVLVAATA